MRILFLGVLGLVASCGGDGPRTGNVVPDDFRKLLKRRDLDPQTCVDNFDIHRDKIIRTEDSREMGAKYLNEIDLDTRDECLRLCCETETCDVFVFEEKSPGSCYLFHCGPPEDFKCKFTRHTNFSSAVLAVNRHLAELEDQIKLTKHEQDLASLRKEYQESMTTTKPTTLHPPGQNQPTVNSPPARRCSRYQFECHSSDECIAIYNACDGIPQCSDGSDEASELGCPATTTLPPALVPNLPPRELVPRIKQMQQITPYNVGAPETIPLSKEISVQHPPPFLSPIPSQEGPPWPRRLEQLPQNNMGGSHIFNHKGGLQVTETESGTPVQYDYKPMTYDIGLPDSNWQHRPWQQAQSVEQNNMNDRSPIYHIDLESQNAWKQQQALQNMPMQHRMQSNSNQLPQQRIQTDKINMQGMPNMFQDRDKMWAVPQLQNSQDNQPAYTQTKVIPIPEETYEKNKQLTEKQNVQYSTEKNNNESADTDEETQEDSDESSNEEHKVKNVSNQPEKHKENKTNKKHNSNKIKKKHLKAEHETNNDKTEQQNNGEQAKEEPIIDQMIIAKFEEDIHDGAAERPPGAILLLTLGVCMTSIMVVLLGCRLKMARRRMRRLGKSPFAHDADYLVNGMYL